MIRYVNSRSELKEAIKERAEEIIIVNDRLVKYLKIAKKSTRAEVFLLSISIMIILISSFFSYHYIEIKHKLFSLIGITFILYFYPTLLFSLIFFGIPTFYNIYIFYNLEINESSKDKDEVSTYIKGKFILKLNVTPTT